MRSFLLLIFRLLKIILLFISPLIYLYGINIKKNIQTRKRLNYNNEEILILGSSHARDDIYKNIIKNSYNLANAGFSLEETYLELLKLEKNHNNLKTVLISFSPFSLHRTNKKPKKTNIVFDLNMEYGDNVFISFFKNPTRKEFTFHNPDLKTISKKQMSKKQIDISSISEYYKNTVDNNGFYGLKFFNLIRKFCEKHKIRLVFIVFPFPKNFNKMLDENNVWKEDLIFMKKNSNHEFYDFSKFYDSENSDHIFFRDGSHLNSNGSLRFTKFLSKNLF